VFGAGGAADPALAARYSALMADSQALVAEDTLRLCDLSGVRHLMDVGGGTGAFLAALGRAHPGVQRTLFDLPAVVAGAGARLGPEVAVIPGSFRDDPLPPGADAISLVRVLYDHADATVARLLAACHAALPPGGRLLLSEPMSGGARPDPATDVYFAVYTLAMGTGRTRSPARLAELLREAGFQTSGRAQSFRPYVTSVLEARVPAKK
jgi:demethylspheroidene O-methyltransferase